MTDHGWINWLLGDKAQVILAGAAGGIVRWLTLRESWRDGIVSIVVGAICALYLGPLIEPLLEPVIGRIVVDAVRRAAFSGFMIGLGGIVVAGLVIDAWNIRRALIRKRDEP